MPKFRPSIATVLGVAFCIFSLAQHGWAVEPVEIWPGLAPGEHSRNRGEVLPAKENERPTITRVVKVTCPTLDVFLPPGNRASSAGVLILPGGGFSKVVPDLEGSEAATKLNELGIAAFVLRYRTTEETSGSRWLRPLQDSQRALRLLRARASEWKLDPKKIGLLGFSAGGQVAAIHLSETQTQTYAALDSVDELSSRPDFAMLIYPWNVVDAKTGNLLPEIAIPAAHPPTFIVHTHDDRSSSVGAALIYAGLRRQKIPAELHIYQNGGHGYGTRPVAGSDIGTWPDRAADWLKRRRLAGG